MIFWTFPECITTKWIDVFKLSNNKYQFVETQRSRWACLQCLWTLLQVAQCESTNYNEKGHNSGKRNYIYFLLLQNINFDFLLRLENVSQREAKMLTRRIRLMLLKQIQVRAFLRLIFRGCVMLRFLQNCVQWSQNVALKRVKCLHLNTQTTHHHKQDLQFIILYRQLRKRRRPVLQIK